MPDKEKFLADEGVDFRLVTALRKVGYGVTSIIEESPSITDLQVLESAVELNTVLLTEDKDFGEMVFRQGMTLPGVVLIRLHGLPGSEKIRIIETAFENHAAKFRDAFSVITDKAVRIRSFEQDDD